MRGTDTHGTAPPSANSSSPDRSERGGSEMMGQGMVTVGYSIVETSHNSGMEMMGWQRQATVVRFFQFHEFMGNINHSSRNT